MEMERMRAQCDSYTHTRAHVSAHKLKYSYTHRHKVKFKKNLDLDLYVLSYRGSFIVGVMVPQDTDNHSTFFIPVFYFFICLIKCQLPGFT